MQYQRDILDGIRRILKALRESSRASEQELGLSGAQLLVLQHLNAKKPLSINELAAKTQTHQSSVSVVVSKLVDAELAKRQESHQDARRVEVVLTNKGLRLTQKKSTQLAHERLFTAIADMPTEQQKLLSELLIQLVDAAGFSNQQASLFFEDEGQVKNETVSKK